jgi:hypothetical protein
MHEVLTLNCVACCEILELRSDQSS